jgi:small subunit ribosomal protein S8
MAKPCEGLCFHIWRKSHSLQKQRKPRNLKVGLFAAVLNADGHVVTCAPLTCAVFVFASKRLKAISRGLKNRRGSNCMNVTDPVGDMIVRIKNAGAVHKETVSVPHSLLKAAIAEKLKGHGYVGHVEKKGRKIRKMLDITLIYNSEGIPKIQGIKRVSKPGRRVYTSAHNIIPIKYGHGTSFISTPQGILTGEEARKAHVGGEVLFHIW